MIMKTRNTNIVKHLLASIMVLVSAVCANAQDYAYPPVDAVTVTDDEGRVQIPYVEWPTPRYILSSIDNEDDDLREFMY